MKQPRIAICKGIVGELKVFVKMDAIEHKVIGT